MSMERGRVGIWWFFLSAMFGGSPVAWAISVGMFVGMVMGSYLLYRMEREAQSA